MSGLEIERKFLVRKDAKWKEQATSSTHIRQGYFASVNTVRIRIRDDKAYLTIKGPSLDGGLSRYEFEKEITTDEAEHLLQLARHLAQSIPIIVARTAPTTSARRSSHSPLRRPPVQ